MEKNPTEFFPSEPAEKEDSCAQKRRLLQALRVCTFALTEARLYLDTHPEDTEALELYRQYQQLYQKVSQAYEREKRPLNHAAPGQGDTYAWLDDPWPWEYAANKGE